MLLRLLELMNSIMFRVIEVDPVYRLSEIIQDRVGLF